MAPMSPINSPTFFVFTSMIYMHHIEQFAFSRLAKELGMLAIM
jgi:hypothetical protein